MTIEVVPASDEAVKVRLARGKPAADIDALRKYHRKYYHATKQESEREHCKAELLVSEAVCIWSWRSLELLVSGTGLLSYAL